SSSPRAWCTSASRTARRTPAATHRRAVEYHPGGRDVAPGRGGPLQTPLMESRIKSVGRLRKRYLPAFYLDPSFLAGFVAAAIGVDRPPSVLAGGLPSLAADEASATVELVRRVRGGDLGLTPVVSALTLLTWMQEVTPLYREAEPGDAAPANREESEFGG